MRLRATTDEGALRHLVALHTHLAKGPIPAAISELVNLRVSQINGCGHCLVLHTRWARQAGVGQDKLDVLAGWRESELFDTRERAALGLAESIARVGDGRRVENPTWHTAAAVFNDHELASLVYTVALISAFNRVNIAFETPATLTGRNAD